MKFVILLSLVAFCYAVPFPMKSIDFTEDGKIVITEPTGKRVTIYKNMGPTGSRSFQIQVEGPNFPTKSVVIDEDPHKVYSTGKDSSGHEVEKRSSKLSTKPVSQSELLDELLKEFQGALTDKEYEKLLSKVYKYVKSGDLDPVVYEMLFEMTVTPVDPADKKLNTEISPASPIYPIYRNWMNYKMSLVNDKIGAKTPYDHPPFGYNRPAYGYNTPAYGHGSPAYGYERPAYGYERPAYGYDRPAYGYDRPTYGFTGAHTPVERVPYQAPYHYGPYSQDYQRTTYEGVAHPTYNHPVTAH